MSDFYLITIPLIIGFTLDLLIGDPLWLPHPIRWFGNSISYFEKQFNTGKYKVLKGSLTSIILISSTYCIFYFSLTYFSIPEIVYFPLASILIFYGLANRNLIDESLKVEKVLQKKGLKAGRKQLSYIVGRDTSELNENKIRTAILETLSENLSDGVIAPLFYYAIGGIPLLFAYKMINTLDSMIGYKSEKYKQFGMFAAKLDDVANYIPARITAFLMALSAINLRSVKYIFKYGNKHASPNAGYPEAALAGILNCRFGGPNIYHGKRVEKPYIGNHNRNVFHVDILKACKINLKSSIIFIFLILGFHLWLSFC